MASTAPRGVAILGPAPPDRGGIARETALLAAELADAYADVRGSRFRAAIRAGSIPAASTSIRACRGRLATPVLDYARLFPGSGRPRRSPLAGRRPSSFPGGRRSGAFPTAPCSAGWNVSRRRPSACCSATTSRITRAARFRKFLALGAFLAADGFVVHAAADRERLERLAPGRPCVVLAHPAASVAPAAASREDARRTLGIPGPGPLVLFLGLVRRYKGVDLLLDAAPEIVRRTQARIAIVGEVFPDARDLLRRAEASPVRDRILVEGRLRSRGGDGAVARRVRRRRAAVSRDLGKRHRGARLRGAVVRWRPRRSAA